MADDVKVGVFSMLGTPEQINTFINDTIGHATRVVVPLYSYSIVSITPVIGKLSGNVNIGMANADLKIDGLTNIKVGINFGNPSVVLDTNSKLLLVWQVDLI